MIRDIAYKRFCLLLWQVVSVLLPVTLRYRDHIGWKFSKIISQLVSLGCSLSAECGPQHHGSTQWEHPKILIQSDQADPLPVDLNAADIRWHIAAEWLWRNGHNGERKPPSLSNGTIDDPYDLAFPKMGNPNAPLVICRISNSHLCNE